MKFCKFFDILFGCVNFILVSDHACTKMLENHKPEQCRLQKAQRLARSSELRAQTLQILRSYWEKMDPFPTHTDMASLSLHSSVCLLWLLCQ